ncbi:MAG: hypothetical protein WBD99_09650 [Thermodesulfobacteriota bacterium]
MPIRTFDYRTDEERTERNKMTLEELVRASTGGLGLDSLEDFKKAIARTGKVPIGVFNPELRRIGMEHLSQYRGGTPTRAEFPVSKIAQGGGEGLKTLLEAAAIGSGNLENISAMLIPKLGIGSINALRSTTGFLPIELSPNRFTPGGFTQKIDLGAGQSGFVFGRQADLDLARNMLQRKQAQLELQTGQRKRRFGKPQKTSLIAQYLAQQG